MAKFWATFDKKIQNMVCWRYFKVSKVVWCTCFGPLATFWKIGHFWKFFWSPWSHDQKWRFSLV